MNTNLTFKILKPSDKFYSEAISLTAEILQTPSSLNFLKKEAEKQNTQIAAFLENTLCATATMTNEDDKIFLQNLAVKQDLQNKGIGSQLLEFCEEFATENEARVIYANARDGAGKTPVNFFTKNEYFCGEEEFLEDGIAHKIVWKILG